MIKRGRGKLLARFAAPYSLLKMRSRATVQLAVSLEFEIFVKVKILMLSLCVQARRVLFSIHFYIDVGNRI